MKVIQLVYEVRLDVLRMLRLYEVVRLLVRRRQLWLRPP